MWIATIATRPHEPTIMGPLHSVEELHVAPNQPTRYVTHCNMELSGDIAFYSDRAEMVGSKSDCGDCRTTRLLRLARMTFRLTRSRRRQP